jgi:anti-sigma factor RsiW
MTPMTCRELVELVTARLEGALTAGDAARFDAHVDECPGCATYVRQIEATIRLSRATAQRLEGSAAVQALLPAFRRWASTMPMTSQAPTRYGKTS